MPYMTYDLVDTLSELTDLQRDLVTVTEIVGTITISMNKIKKRNTKYLIPNNQPSEKKRNSKTLQGLQRM